MPAKATNEAVEAKEAPEAPSKDLDVVREKLQNRYQELTRAFNNEPNLANRYDLKIRIEELTAIFEILFR